MNTIVRRSVMLWRTALVATLMATPLCADDASAVAAKKNVLFIICDDLNCDIGSYGHLQVKTPNIDRLAARGVRFENAYCQYPLCGPSRASFMTGMYPDQTLIRGNAILLRSTLPDVQSMSQMFIRNGYQAARVGKIYHYNVPRDIGNPGHDDPASWTHTINPIGRDKTDEARVITLKKGQYGGTLSWMAAEGTDEEQTDGIAATESVKLLKQYAQEETPFFLAVGLYRPHTPFVAPKPHFEHYPKGTIEVPRVPVAYHKTLPQDAVKSITRKREQRNLARSLARDVIQAYWASITFADAQVGRILDALRETGLDKNTIVIFTSDHGYHMGEHGHWQKTTLFENAARVPLIIARPGMATAGKSTGSIAEMIDFYPTLAELCGLEAPGYLSGVSLVPVLDNTEATPRLDALTQYANGYGLRTARYRYIEWGKDGARGAELYDHYIDTGEMNNLFSEAEPALIKELSEKLRARIAKAQTAPEGLTRRGAE